MVTKFQIIGEFNKPIPVKKASLAEVHCELILSSVNIKATIRRLKPNEVKRKKIETYHNYEWHT